MKIAVLSDIHANLVALEAVVTDARHRGATRFVCLGDIVGYGPRPAECVQSIRRLDARTVIGNHDAWSVRPVAWSRLAVSPTAIEGLRHARAQLSPHERAWLRQLPFIAHLENFALVHGSFHRPERWPCLASAADARSSFRQQPSRIAFFGHTHTPGFWEENGGRFIEPPPGRPIRLAAHNRYALNPGSVGNPRTPAHAADPRAQYLLFDTERLAVTFHRVAYDVAACVAAMRAAGLPEEMISRVELGY